uniref:Immunoglobulin domain-containing protein n=1 Tax=Mola mola TaxID=94237 RepID=A0A3Q3XMC8_MOLML
QFVMVFLWLLLLLVSLISVKTKAKTAVEGQDFYFSCKYKDGQGVNTKYFSHDESSTPLILTDKHDQWVSIGRFSLISDEGNTFYVTIDSLTKDDSGTYWCGIERHGLDTYNKVDLIVIKGETSICSTPLSAGGASGRLSRGG